MTKRTHLINSDIASSMLTHKLATHRQAERDGERMQTGDTHSRKGVQEDGAGLELGYRTCNRVIRTSLWMICLYMRKLVRRKRLSIH